MSTLKELVFGVDYSKMPYNKLCDEFHAAKKRLKKDPKNKKDLKIVKKITEVISKMDQIVSK
jgi:hypothetical protein